MKTMSADSPVLEAYEEYKRYTADPDVREQERLRQENLLEIKLRELSAKDERSIEIAQNMKAMGLTNAVISQATGLTESETENLP